MEDWEEAFDKFGFVYPEGHPNAGRMDQDLDTPRELKDWIARRLNMAYLQGAQNALKGKIKAK